MNMEKDYAHLGDREWVELLLEQTVDDKAVHYFVQVKCKNFLLYIQQSIMGFRKARIDEITSDFYLFLSHDHFKVLRDYKGLNNASLATYLSLCTCRHFIEKRKRECARIPFLESLDELQESICNEDNEDEENSEKRRDMRAAFEQLNERDQKILRYQVIESKPYLAIADELWPYLHSAEREWQRLPAKRVQDTLAIVKKRALLNLYVQWKKIREKEG